MTMNNDKHLVTMTRALVQRGGGCLYVGDEWVMTGHYMLESSVLRPGSNPIFLNRRGEIEKVTNNTTHVVVGAPAARQLNIMLTQIHTALGQTSEQRRAIPVYQTGWTYKLPSGTTSIRVFSSEDGEHIVALDAVYADVFIPLDAATYYVPDLDVIVDSNNSSFVRRTVSCVRAPNASVKWAWDNSPMRPFNGQGGVYFKTL